MCPETDKLGGTDLTLNRWGPERFSQLPESHSRAGWGLWVGILEDPSG